MRPTRIITYAWGDRYIDELLSLTIPALLAPGNLPHVAASTSCELVILTEERSFAVFSTHPAILRARKFCPIRLIGLDDLIAMKDKYGMALTYALHRGFSDLGPAMTESWQIFLNADFVLADGSLRNLLARLERGERIVASPSYCVNAKEMIAELRKHIDPATSVLAIQPRELAALAIRHRHNTVRGKTLNQRVFNIRLMDQFYWLTDNTTLLGHQMPIAIVGMRPERHVTEPNSYWDHGLMKEYCPDAEVCVLGDSDEFLMVELRDSDVAEDQIGLGWPAPKEIAERAIVFLTPYQFSFAQYPLTLHSADLPASVADDRAKLRAGVDEILSFVPEYLPSHIDHPQWDYHQPTFFEARHKALSARLGPMTRLHPPLASLSKIDQLWWRLDGMEKQFQERRAELVEHKNCALALLNSDGAAIQQRRQDIDRKLLADLAAIDFAPAKGGEMVVTLAISGSPSAESSKADPYADAVGRYENEIQALDNDARRQRDRLSSVVTAVTARYEQQLSLLEFEFQQQYSRLESEYRRFLQKRVTSAATPFVRITHGPVESAVPLPSNRFLQLILPGYYKIFGRLPRVSQLHPQWAALHHVVGLVDDLAQSAPDSVLLIGSGATNIEAIADEWAGTRAVVAMIDAKSGNLARAFGRPPNFDLCVCDFSIADASEFSEIFRSVRPLMRKGGKIVGFHLNSNLAAISPNTVAAMSAVGEPTDQTRIHLAGSDASVFAIRVWCRVMRQFMPGGLGKWLLLIMALTLMSPLSFAANRAEARRGSAAPSQHPEVCTSVTVEVVVDGAAA